MKHIYSIIISLCLLIAGCGRNSETDRQLDRAEGLMLSAPDSSLLILDNIQAGDLSGKEQKARLALLKSMALDKNYIVTTTFDVLQPAIDYYSENGSFDNRMKMRYYQGRIYQNKNDYEMAMQCFIKAKDFQNEFMDTLAYANLLVAQGNLYVKSYQMHDFIKNNLFAADLYKNIGDEQRQLSSLIRALDGSIIVGDKTVSDSIMALTNNLIPKHTEFEETLSLIKMAYGIKFDSEIEIKRILDSIPNIYELDDESKLDITMGLLKLNDPIKATLVFESISEDSPIINSLRYISMKPDIFEAVGKYKDALQSYKEFYTKIESENEYIYSLKTAVAQERHNVELDSLRQIQYRNKIIWMSVCSILGLLVIIGVISYYFHISKMKRMIAEKEQSRLQLENDNLQKQNSVLALEKRAAKLEAERQNLAGDNMRLRISQLEAENEQLKDLSEKEELPDDVRVVIKDRIEMLNAIFAAKILDKDTGTSSYDDWVKRELGDKERFMNSNRLAYKASHPMFIKYLEEHGLTEYEINYLCLYAIGLKGKEVSSYMELRRHYNISSEIRRKLGIDEHDTNIGIYVKKLLKRF